MLGHIYIPYFGFLLPLIYEASEANAESRRSRRQLLDIAKADQKSLGSATLTDWRTTLPARPSV